jgi:RND family efflux transporter MFP subunit
MFKLLLIIFCCSHLIGLSWAVEQTIEVQIEEISNVSQSIEFEINGRISKKSFNIISAQTSGIVEDLVVDDGMTFARGDLLMKIIDSDLKFQVAAAEVSNQAALFRKKQALISFTKKELLYKKKLISEEVFNLSQLSNSIELHSYQTTKIILDQLLQRQKNADVISMNDSTVVERLISEGEWVNKGTPLLKVLNTQSSIFLNINLSMEALDRLSHSKSAKISTPMGLVLSVEPRHMIVIPNINESSQLVSVVLNLDDADIGKDQLFPGQLLRIKLKVDFDSSVLVVPADAVTQKEGNHFVWKWQGDSAPQYIRVKLLDYFGRFALISAHRKLSISDELIVSGNNYLFPNSKVVLGQN